MRERNTAPFAAVDTAHDECAAVSEEQAAAPTQPSCSGPSPFITLRADKESDSTALTNPQGTRAESSLSIQLPVTLRNCCRLYPQL